MVHNEIDNKRRLADLTNNMAGEAKKVEMSQLQSTERAINEFLEKKYNFAGLLMWTFGTFLIY
jgi:hypothetical protein